MEDSFILFLESSLDLLENFCGFRLKVNENIEQENWIAITIDSSQNHLGAEGYKLTIQERKIEIISTSKNGAFYGFQTFIQLIFSSKQIKISEEVNFFEIGCLEITDNPRFKWRGFMLDVARHFHDIGTIKRILDLLALMKMNIFHWHLTDDQGWRIEIKKYPKLIEIGSKRKDSKVGGRISKKYRGEPHEGYYTQEEVKDVIKYAQARFIKIIPEIEIPGHSSAAIAAYPELSCRNQKIEVQTKYGIFSNVFCSGKESTFEFLKNVIDEIAQLFPSDVIHIGGDEVLKKEWKKCEHCKKRRKKENLESAGKLHSYITKRIGDYLNKIGKRMMGWNQILDDSIDRNTIVQWWMGGRKKVLNYINTGGEVVISKFFRLYLDYSYFMTPLRKTYSFKPIPKGVKREKHNNILGIESPLWTEWVPDKEKLYWQILPRLAAVSEVGWTQEKRKNYKSFESRFLRFSKILDMLEINYAPLEKTNPSIFAVFKQGKHFP